MGVEFRGRDRHTEVRSRYEFLRWSVFCLRTMVFSILLRSMTRHSFALRKEATRFSKKRFCIAQTESEDTGNTPYESSFTRKSNDDIYDRAVTYTFIPSCPNGRNNYIMASVLDDSTFFMRIPSFGRSNKEVIEETLSRYRDDIRRCPYFIIDLRGNSGGQDPAYEALLPLCTPILSSPKVWSGTLRREISRISKRH